MAFSTEELADKLTDGFVQEIDGEAVQGEMAVSPNVIASQVTGKILAHVAKFLAENSDFLPPKEAVLRAVNSAVDMMLARLGRPWLTALISVPVKNMIAKAVDAMYDAILNPRTVV